MSEHKCGPWCEDYCYSCRKHEPFTNDSYQGCSECLHVFETEKELVDKHNEVIRRMATEPQAPFKPVGLTKRTVKRGKEVLCCPLCIHDF